MVELVEWEHWKQGFVVPIKIQDHEFGSLSTSILKQNKVEANRECNESNGNKRDN